MLVSVVFVSLTLGLHESTRDSGFRTASQLDWSQMKNGEAKNTFLLDSAGGVDVVGRGGGGIWLRSQMQMNTFVTGLRFIFPHGTLNHRGRLNLQHGDDVWKMHQLQ